MQPKLFPLVLCIIWLAGCSAIPQQRSETSPVVTARPDTSQQTSRPKQPVHQPPLPVVILVSSKLSPYTEVAQRLSDKLGAGTRTYILPPNHRDQGKLLHKIERLKRAQVVTVGLEATRMVKALGGYNQIFCQVFNYTEEGLVAKRRKGVSMIPGLRKTFVTWKQLSPSLHEVAVISGPNLEDILERARGIAAELGITLHPVTVENDKEYLYAYKELADKVQGYWLLPDNRVLSVRTLREVMTFSVRNGKQVVAFNDDLLRLGGLFSVESSYDDIADKVLQRLKQADNQDAVPGEDLMPLDEVVLKINPVMVQRLGLTLPKQYREVTSGNDAE